MKVATCIAAAALMAPYSTNAFVAPSASVFLGAHAARGQARSYSSPLQVRSVLGLEDHRAVCMVQGQRNVVASISWCMTDFVRCCHCLWPGLSFMIAVGTNTHGDICAQYSCY